MSKLTTVEVDTDLLIIGGGMAACGAAVEAAYWAGKHNLKVTLVDKASIERSGAVGMGLSAINQYIGLSGRAEKQNTVEDYVKYVTNDLMGITRQDLVYDIARHVDSSVHLFEQWGLPIWKNDAGKYVSEGRWQIMLNGESYKVIVAEAARNALGRENIFERVFIVEPLVVNNCIAGAVGFSLRENKFYVFKAKAVLVAMGGTSGVFRPRSTGEGLGRGWYPPFSTGSSAYFTLKAGAEMTCQEVRFVPVRFKDAYGPVGAWFLHFKSRAGSALGGEYMDSRGGLLEGWAPYSRAKPLPANLRNYLGMLEIMEGKGPLLMKTDQAIAQLLSPYQEDQESWQKAMENIKWEVWGDFLNMTVSQALLWAATDTDPATTPSEIAAAEPYFIGSHSGASGAWVSGSPELAPQEYCWGHSYMTTVAGLFAAGDASGASSHKFSSGSHAEGRLAAKSAISYILAVKFRPDCDYDEVANMLKTEILKPLKVYDKHQGYSTDPNINPYYIRPKMFLYRLQKIMDEYAGGVSSNFTTNAPLLERALVLLAYLKEDAGQLAAADLHELMRCWENVHRTWQAEAHVRALLFREETRWPGYYVRADYPNLDEANWHCFTNLTWLPDSDSWEYIKRPVIKILD